MITPSYLSPELERLLDCHMDGCLKKPIVKLNIYNNAEVKNWALSHEKKRAEMPELRVASF